MARLAKQAFLALVAMALTGGHIATNTNPKISRTSAGGTSASSVTNTFPQALHIALTPASPDINTYTSYLTSIIPASRRVASHLYVFRTPADVATAGTATIMGLIGHPTVVNFSVFNGAGGAPKSRLPAGACQSASLTNATAWRDASCQTAIVAAATTMAGYLTTGDYFLIGNEQIFYFKSGGGGGNNTIRDEYRVLVDAIEAAVRAACSGCKVGVADHYDPSQETLLKDTTHYWDTTLDVMGLTVYPEFVAGAPDCGDYHTAISALTNAQTFVDSVSPAPAHWAVTETGICTSPTFGGSEEIQAAWAGALKTWMTAAAGTLDPDFVSIFIAMDGDTSAGAASTNGCQANGTALVDYTCTLGVRTKDNVAKLAYGILFEGDSVPDPGFTVYAAASGSAWGGAIKPSCTVSVTTDGAGGSGSFGSLRYCATTFAAANGGANITLASGICGTITLSNHLLIDQPNVTINLGPSSSTCKGVQVTGYEIQVGADNVILRYVRARNVGSGLGDNIHIRGGVRDVVLDHVDVGGAADEPISIATVASDAVATYDTRRITIQNSLIRGANATYSSKGPLVGDSTAGVCWHEVAFYRNVFTGYTDRGPNVGAPPGCTSDVLLVQNVNYDFIYGVAMYAWTAAANLYVDAVNNLYKVAPSRSGLTTTTESKIPIMWRDGQSLGTVYLYADNNFPVDGATRTWHVDVNSSVAATPLETDALSVETGVNGNKANSISGSACPGGTSCAQYSNTTSRLYSTYPVATQYTSGADQLTLLGLVVNGAGATLPCADSETTALKADVTNGTRAAYSDYPPGAVTLPTLSGACP